MLIAHAGLCLDRAELRTLRSARRAEVSAKLCEALWREGLQCGELPGDNVNEGVHSAHGCESAERVVCLHQANERVELVKNELEPQLARLVDDDEKELVGVLGPGARPLQPEQLIECQIRRIGYLAAGLFR